VTIYTLDPEEPVIASDIGPRTLGAGIWPVAGDGSFPVEPLIVGESLMLLDEPRSTFAGVGSECHLVGAGRHASHAERVADQPG
jgi:hypothetical protein